MLEHIKVFHRHKRASDCSNGLYVDPKMGATVDSLQPLPISWDPSCLSSAQEVDIYLYAPSSATPRIHVWEHIATSRATYTAQLMPRWWNATSSQQLQVIIVPTGDAPFMSKFAAGPVFTATYTAPSTGSTPAAADTSQIDSGITLVNDVANANAKVSSGKKAAAGVLVPLFLVLLGVAIYIKLKRNREQAKRRAWTEKIDTRMSTISTEWKSVSAAGAQAAIRNSIAVGSRNSSSFSFGAIRPPSTAASADLNEKEAEKKSTTMRTGTGVGLRNPNALSQSIRTSERTSRVSFADQPRVSRVSFAEQTRPSTEARRTRAYHTGYVPPVPSLPTKNKEELSPKQTAGALSLTSEDIKARIAAAANGKTKTGSVSGSEIDEVLPALSLMRTGNDPSKPDDFLLPTPPEPTHAKPTAPTTNNTRPLFPMPLGQQPTQQVLSPDEMLKAYAERKKSLAVAASAGRIGAPMRTSASASTLASSNYPTSSSSTSIKSSNSNTPIQTVGSIHDTGMRVAYHSDVARFSLKPLPVSSHRTSLASSTTTSTTHRKSSHNNPFVIPPLPSTPTTYVLGEVDGDGDNDSNPMTNEHKKTKSQAHAEAYTRAEKAVSLAKEVELELAAAEAELAEAEAFAQGRDVVVGGTYPYAISDPAIHHPYAYAGAYGNVVDAPPPAADEAYQGEMDVGMAGRGAFGYSVKPGGYFKRK